MNSEYQRFLDKMRRREVTVLGMGVSNVPLIRLLLDAGAHVCVRDRKERAQVDDALLREFQEHGAEFRFGDGYLKDITGEFAFKTPGMRWDLPELMQARRDGVTVTSEMEMFFQVCPCPVIGVTGSDGKTTTTSIIYELLSAQGRSCYVGGNIGMPLLSRAGEMTASDIVVVELSSFQLMDMTKSPEIAVITNITPNHLDVHTSMREYIEAKRNIFKNQSGRGRVVLNYDNALTRDLAEDVKGDVTFFSSGERIEKGYCVSGGTICRARGGILTKVLDCAEIRIPGLHNIENYMAAIAAAEQLADDETVRRVAREFGGVEHRMELVREFRGVKYYNDSIASSPTRTAAGLRAHETRVILIAGGYDKKIPFDGFGIELLKHVKGLILIGQTAENIRQELIDTPGYSEEKLSVLMCDTLEAAVIAAAGQAESGDIVALSPACASFDMFENFEERGERFKELVRAL